MGFISVTKQKTLFLISFFIVTICIFVFFTKNAVSKQSVDQNKFKILSTIAMVDGIAKEIGKDKFSFDLLIKGDIDPHSYELVKGDSEKLQDADIILYNGLGLEHGASVMYHIQKHPMAIPVAESIVETSEYLFVDGIIDPHLWMDVSLWLQIIDPIQEAFSKLDPQNREFYLQNSESLKSKLRALHEEVFQLLQSIPSDQRYLVTSHDAFNYFSRRYLSEPCEMEDDKWRNRFIAPEGLAPDGQMSIMDIKLVIDSLLTNNVSVVFPESNISRSSLQKIVSVCKKKGKTVLIAKDALYGDTMGSKHSGPESYEEMIRHNARVLKRNLNPSEVYEK